MDFFLDLHCQLSKVHAEDNRKTTHNSLNMKKFMKAMAAMILMTAVVFSAGCKPDDDNGGGGASGSLNGHNYVDLGLPSGTLWATCNVGADTPEGHGDYFAWGETTTKTTYNWSTYKYCNGGEEMKSLTKYCNDSNFGYNDFTDNLTVLQPMDDAATANWGNGWCMPTVEQWRELYLYTTHTWTEQNGVNGRLFTASNGNNLFLPAAGYRWDDVHNSAGSIGYYWSSSLDTISPYNAWNFNFDLDSYYVFAYFRSDGRSVRAACCKTSSVNF